MSCHTESHFPTRPRPRSYRLQTRSIFKPKINISTLKKLLSDSVRSKSCLQDQDQCLAILNQDFSIKPRPRSYHLQPRSVFKSKTNISTLKKLLSDTVRSKICLQDQVQDLSIYNRDLSSTYRISRNCSQWVSGARFVSEPRPRSTH